MNQLIKDLLEDYLSGSLTGQQRAEFEAYLKEHPSEAAELALYEESAELVRELRPPEGEVWDPEVGFYARVIEHIDSQRRTPFWMVFLQPAFARRLAFASLMWLALLGGYVLTFDSLGEGTTTHVAERMLTQPPSPDYDVRLGTDLERNRDNMLAVLIAGR